MKIRKVVLLACLVCLSMQFHAQRKYVYRKDRFFVGSFVGMNFTQPIVSDRYNVLVQTPQSAPGDFEKKYKTLAQNRGGNYGLYVSFAYTKYFSLIIQPGFRSQRFNYMTSYSWEDTLNVTNINKEMLHRQKISNVSIPVLTRWDFTTRHFSPFLQVGLSADFIYFANKSIYYDTKIDGEVDRKSANQSSVGDFTNHMRKINVGLVGGGGITYYRESFAMTLASNVKYGLRNVIDDQKRYADFTGFGVEYLDVMDQFKLLDLDIQLTLMIPIHKKW